MSKKEPTDGATRESKGVWKVLARHENDGNEYFLFAAGSPASFPDQASAIKWIRNEAPAGTYTPVKCWPSVTVELETKQVRNVK